MAAYRSLASHALRAIAPTLLLLLLLLGCAPALDWREVRPAGVPLVLLLPCRPDHRVQSGVAVGGGLAEVALWSCRAGDASWSVTRATVADPGRVAEVIEALPAALLMRPGTRLIDEAPYRIAGATPNPRARVVRFETAAPDGHRVSGRLAVFVHGLSVLQVARLADRAVPDAADATFFDSPRITVGPVAR